MASPVSSSGTAGALGSASTKRSSSPAGCGEARRRGDQVRPVAHGQRARLGGARRVGRAARAGSEQVDDLAEGVDEPHAGRSQGSREHTGCARIRLGRRVDRRFPPPGRVARRAASRARPRASPRAHPCCVGRRRGLPRSSAFAGAGAAPRGQPPSVARRRRGRRCCCRPGPALPAAPSVDGGASGRRRGLRDAARSSSERPG